MAASAQSRPAQDSETQDSQAPDSQAQHSQSKNTAVQPQKLQQVSGSQASASGFSQKNVSEKIIDTKAVAENTDTGGQESSEQEEVAPKVVVERLEQLIEADTWHDFIQQLSITGSIFQIINNSVVTQASQNQLQLNTLQSVEHFLTASAKGKIEQAMGDVLKQKVTLNIEFVETLENTPKLISEKRRVEQLKSIRGEFIDNPKVASLLQTFETDIAIENIQIH